MGDPACRPRDREDRFPGAGDHARHAGQGRDREVDVRLGQGLLPDLGEHGLGHRELARFRRGAPYQVEQHDRARVTAPVDEVTEPGHLPAAPQQFPTTRGTSSGRGGGDQGLRAQGCPAVQGPAHRAQAGPDHGVRVRPDRGGGPGGQRRGRQLVVSQQHQRGGQRPQQAGGRRSHSLGHRRSAIESPGAGRARGQAGVHHGGDEVPPAASTAAGSSCRRSGSVAAVAGRSPGAGQAAASRGAARLRGPARRERRGVAARAAGRTGTPRPEQFGDSSKARLTASR